MSGILSAYVFHQDRIGLCYGPGVEVCYTSQEVLIVLSSTTQKTTELSVDATVSSLKLQVHLILKLQVHLIYYAHHVRNFLPMPA